MELSQSWEDPQISLSSSHSTKQPQSAYGMVAWLSTENQVLRVSRSAQALGDVKRLFPDAPAQYLTTVCIPILLVFPSSYIYLVDWQSHSRQHPSSHWHLAARNRSIDSHDSRFNWASPRGQRGKITCSSMGNRQSAYHDDGKSMRGRVGTGYEYGSITTFESCHVCQEWSCEPSEACSICCSQVKIGRDPSHENMKINSSICK